MPYSDVVAALDFGGVLEGVAAVALALAGVFVLVRGFRILLGMIGGGGQLPEGFYSDGEGGDWRDGFNPDYRDDAGIVAACNTDEVCAPDDPSHDDYV